jgi:hypothetical protein
MISPWYIDIKETWLTDSGDEREHIFSVLVPSPFPADEDIPIGILINAINFAFEQASNPINWVSSEPSPVYDSETWIRYKLFAQGRYPVTARSSNTPPSLTTPTEDGLWGNHSFAIRYNIKGDPAHTYDPPGTWGTLKYFTIQFRDGIHGYGQINDGTWVAGDYAGKFFSTSAIKPSAHLEILNYSDVPATMLPYSTHTAIILDNPPLPPVPEIVPFVGVSSKILLLLNSSTGHYLARPVIILDSDVAAIAQQYVAQTGNPIGIQEVQTALENPLSSLKIRYKNDDPILKYQVFRTTSRPESYADFNVLNNPHATVTGDVTIEKKASSAFLLDDVEPNTKYYYCFRAIDVHNNFSNPTHVYEVELVDNDGQVYLILNTMLFNNEAQIVKKTAKRYIYIEPSMRNLHIPEGSLPAAESNIEDNPNPGAPIFEGTSSETCWNKTFKVRLTSKKSGKKIDLNILFKNTGVVNP